MMNTTPVTVWRVSYGNAIERYRKFRNSPEGAAGGSRPKKGHGDPAACSAVKEVGKPIGLECEMQAALRIEIEQLERGLTIVDDGAENKVDSGFVNITARDASGTTVVIELKTGTARQGAVAQMLSYTGDVAAEEESGNVRGILVASNFDARRSRQPGWYPVSLFASTACASCSQTDMSDPATSDVLAVPPP